MLGNPNAIELLREHPDKIYWDMLSRNPDTVEELLEENPDEIADKIEFLLAIR